MEAAPDVLGYRMPAEWEPHAATWLAWPHQSRDWPGKMAPIPWVYTEIIRLLTRFEAVHLLVNDLLIEKRAKKMLADAGADLAKIRFWMLPTDRVWVRDYGPIFVVNSRGEAGVLDWRFNAWAKYPDWENDDAIPSKILKEIDAPSWTPRAGGKRVVLEGGSIDVNGAGCVLTTEECLLSNVQARNPHLSREQVERVLRDFLGADKVLWLKDGIVGDDTHGHIDDIARFVNRSTIVACEEPNTADPNHRILKENLDRLGSMTDVEGKRLDIISLPMPRPVIFRGQRLPASYANFYIANNQVLVPTFNDPADRKALGILGDLFPDREVVGVHAVDLVWGLGTLHCLSQQQPAASNLPMVGGRKKKKS